MNGNEVYSIRRKLFGKEIRAGFQKYGNGYQVVVSGGDLPHIGSVTNAGPGKAVRSMTRPGHKDSVISDKWAAFLSEELDVPVSVTCGIHYDHATSEQIEMVIRTTDEMLRQAVDYLRADHCNSMQ